MNLNTILREKGSVVFTTSPENTLADVVASLVEHNCGSLVVCDEGQVVGIITERDILRACAASDLPLATARVDDIMTRHVFTGTIDDKISDVMRLMTDKRIRHLPVLEDGALVGMISIGDVVRASHDLLVMENHYLKHYLHS
ncbi:MAG: CBS domain-containing protein [Planctomycetes bacterium]|nr:CBS domain-containing protein [Planctomycetota bacterium]